MVALAACTNGMTTASPRSPSSSSGVGLAATGASVAIPITTSSTGLANVVSVEVTVGGGDPFPVLLDTGSSGLIVDSSLVGPGVTAASGTLTQDYAGGAVSGSLATAVVGMGSVSTPPIIVGLVDPSTAATAFAQGMHGILGISTTGTSTAGLMSPSLQLAAPLNTGSTLQIEAADGSPGTWTLGPVTAPASATSVPLIAQSPPSSAPPGYPAFAQQVEMCWTIGSQAAKCAGTVLDTGNGTPALDATVYASFGPVHTILPSGLPVTIGLSGAAPLWSFTTGQTVGTNAVKLSELGSDAPFNTGLPFFYGRTVAWDYAAGQLLIGPST